MRQREGSRIVWTACVLVGVIAGAGTLAGCSSTGSGTSVGERALAMVPKEYREAVNNYVGGLTDINKLLATVADPQSGAQVSRKLEADVAKVNTASGTINAAPAGVKDAIMEALAPQLDQLSKVFNDQVTRLTTTNQLGSLKPILDKLQLVR